MEAMSPIPWIGKDEWAPVMAAYHRYVEEVYCAPHGDSWLRAWDEYVEIRRTVEDRRAAPQ